MIDNIIENPPRRIGLLLVHGIGDQTKNEHLQSVAKNIVRTASLVYGKQNVSVQMFPGLEQKSDLSILINDNGTLKVLDLVEVWWRDLGQKRNPVTVVKFWLWAATFSGTRGRFFAENSLTTPPLNNSTLKGHVRLVDRLSLFFKITYFFLLLFPLRVLTLLMHFIPGMDHVNLFSTVFTYMSSVQLYQQRQSSQGGTLVDFDQSRRISIQRRFADSVVSMAEKNFDRWYIMGHSLGSVIALKGLMYPDEAWARFITCDRWLHQNMRFRKKVSASDDYPDRPRKPTWLQDDDALDASMIFAKCSGLLTWGSPLETFARTWPGMVHLNKSVDVNINFEWINIYDHVDIIASKLTSFDVPGVNVYPKNFLCNSSNLIFSAHTSYLKPSSSGKDCVAETVLRWMLSGEEKFEDLACLCNAINPSKYNIIARRAIALTQWALVFVIGVFVWPISVNLFLKTILFFPEAVVAFLAEASRSINGDDEPYWVKAFRQWSNNTVDFLKGLQPTLDLAQDASKLLYILSIVGIFVVIGSLAHNLRDRYLHYLSEQKRSMGNKNISIIKTNEVIGA